MTGVRPGGWRRKLGGLLWLSLGAAACWADPPPDDLIGSTPALHAVRTPFDLRFDASRARVELGRRIFNDTGLSEPRGTSCASCHDTARGLGGLRAQALGVAQGSRRGHFGVRNVPALRYVRYTPALYFFIGDPDDDPAPQPRGGFFADGRVSALFALVREPLLNPQEMNNRSAAALASKIDRADYADGLRAEFGTPSLDDPERAIATLGQALQSYLESDALSPFTSRYDEYVRGRAQMSEPEMKGLRLFRSSDKGNCASCHAFNPSSSNPLRSLFTDFGYDAVAVPRNPAVPENRKPAFNDLGLCTTTAVAHAWPEPAQWCGYFKTPSLRNVAIRERFMHNGVFKDLRSVVAFYATRSIDPGRWYPNGEAFDDLPAKYRANVNIGSTPYNRRAGSKPALDDDDIDAIVAFLRTLTDRDLEPLLPQVKGR